MEKAPLWQKKHCSATFTIVPRFPQICDLEEKILAKINETGIGPMGYGGRVTAPWR
ncbi:MAG: fumarate hydratase [Bacilli bacterium]